MKCDCGGKLRQQGSYRFNNNLVPSYKCLSCEKTIKPTRKFKRLTQEEINLILTLRKNKMEIRKISKVLKVNVNTISYQLKKNIVI